MAYPQYVQPLPGESLLGFIHRVSAANHFARVSELLKDIGHRRPGDLMTEQSLDILAERTSESAFDLRRMHIATENATGSILRAGHPDVSLRPNVCGQCLAERGYHRLAWHLRTMTHCPFHGASLFGHCQNPKCETPLKWLRSDLLHCGCGASFAEQTPAVRILSGDELAGIRLIFEKCEQPFDWPTLTPLLPKDFSELSAPDLSAVLRILGNIATIASPRPLRAASVYLTSDGTPLVTRGLQLLPNWPTSFEAALEGMGQNHKGLPPQLTSYLRDALLKRRLPGSRIILLVLQRFLRARGHFQSFGLKATEGKPHLIDLAEASAILGTSEGTMRHLAKKMGLRDPTESKGPYKHWLLRDRFMAYVEKRQMDGKPGVKVTRLARRLMISVDEVRRLALEGVFGQRAFDRFQRPKFFHFFYEEEVDTVINAIHSAVSAPASRRVSPKSWQEVCQLAYQFDSNLGLVIKGILAGEIRPLAFSGTLSSLRFDKNEILDFVMGAKERSLGLESGRLLTRREAIHYCGIPICVFDRALFLGALKRQSNRSEAPHNRADLDTFLANYTCVALVARALSIKGARIGRLLVRHRIEPIGGDSGKHADGKLFRKSDLDVNWIKAQLCEFTSRPQKKRTDVSTAVAA